MNDFSNYQKNFPKSKTQPRNFNQNLPRQNQLPFTKIKQKDNIFVSKTSHNETSMDNNDIAIDDFSGQQMIRTNISNQGKFSYSNQRNDNNKNKQNIFTSDSIYSKSNFQQNQPVLPNENRSQFPQSSNFINHPSPNFIEASRSNNNYTTSLNNQFIRQPIDYKVNFNNRLNAQEKPVSSFKCLNTNIFIPQPNLKDPSEKPSINSIKSTEKPIQANSDKSPTVYRNIEYIPKNSKYNKKVQNAEQEMNTTEENYSRPKLQKFFRKDENQENDCDNQYSSKDNIYQEEIHRDQNNKFNFNKPERKLQVKKNYEIKERCIEKIEENISESMNRDESNFQKYKPKNKGLGIKLPNQRDYQEEKFEDIQKSKGKAIKYRNQNVYEDNLEDYPINNEKKTLKIPKKLRDIGELTEEKPIKPKYHPKLNEALPDDADDTFYKNKGPSPKRKEIDASISIYIF